VPIAPGGLAMYKTPIAVGQTSITSVMKFRPNLGNRFHQGVDFGWTPTHPDPAIQASAAGSVVWSGVKEGWGFGTFIVIEHTAASAGEYTLYGHLASADVAAGKPVQAGDKIGVMGMTHDTLAPVGKHLHFEILTGAGTGLSGWLVAFSGNSKDRWLYRKNPILEIDALGGDIRVNDYGEATPKEQKKRAFEEWVSGVAQQTGLPRAKVLESFRDRGLADSQWWNGTPGA
jgi:murein DD-endopeptidase MepM/ murein hydrolase activator NlpD